MAGVMEKLSLAMGGIGVLGFGITLYGGLGYLVYYFITLNTALDYVFAGIIFSWLMLASAIIIVKMHDFIISFIDECKRLYGKKEENNNGKDSNRA